MDTQSQVASISKQFVAACALILVGRGVLDLEDPVTRHLSIAGLAWDEVSLHHLLTHTSGMCHWCDQRGFAPSTPTPADERLRLFLDAPRPGRPGEVFCYSSPGYLVLSAVLAAAAGGGSYEQLVRELVIDPLELAATHLGSPGPGPVALGYRQGQPVDSWDLATMPGTGDVWCTARDLARFVVALHTGDLLPTPAQSLLHDVRVPAGAWSGSRMDVHGYDAGHFAGTIDGQRAYLHPGDNPGYQSLALWLPDSSTAVVVLSNEETADLESTAVRSLREASANG